MEICGEHGDEIVHNGRTCPACDQIETIKLEYREELESEIDGFNNEIDILNDKIDDLEHELSQK